jgi:hypothetical protein
MGRGVLCRLAAGVAFVALLAVAGPADANRARRAALAGNLAIADDTDLYLFPGEIAWYATRVDLDVAPRVTGAMLFGEPLSPVAFGFALNRDQTLNNLDGVDDLALFSQIHGGVLGSLAASEVGTLLVGLPAGIGLRLSLTHGAEGETFDTADGEKENSTSVTGVELSGGWSRRTDDLQLDTVATLRFNGLTEKVQAGGSDFKFEDSGSPAFSLGGRGIFRVSDSLSWVALANFSLRDYTGESSLTVGEEKLVVERAAKATILRAGVGPQLRIGDWVTVASLASIGYGKVSIDEEDETALDLNSTAIAIPGFDTSVEAHVSRYVDLRWGFRSRYLIEEDEQKDESKETENDRATAFRSTGDFAWTAGLGINYWDFDWDVEFSKFLDDGPSQLIISLSWSPPAESFRRPPPPLGRPSPFDADEDETPAPLPPPPPPAAAL